MIMKDLSLPNFLVDLGFKKLALWNVKFEFLTDLLGHYIWILLISDHLIKIINFKIYVLINLDLIS